MNIPDNKYNWFLVILLGIALIASCGKNSANTVKINDFISAKINQYRQGTGIDDSIGVTSIQNDTAELKEDVNRIIEESDIIKIVGSNLYILSRYQGLFICNAEKPDNPVITGHVDIPGTPFEMYVRNGEAYILVEKSLSLYSVGDLSYIPAYSNRSSAVYDVSISDPTKPHVVNSIEIDGKITDSRIVGTILYAVTTIRNTWPESDNEPITRITSIDVSNTSPIHINAASDLKKTVNYTHVTDQAIFTVSYGYYNDMSTITYVDISAPDGTIAVRGSIDIPGNVTDKFKLDYYAGYLRVCTYQSSSRISYLTTIRVSNSGHMDITAKIELGKGESLFATRFDGEKAYMVTFFRTDPLWVINLKNPEKPEIAGKLEVPGWSTHIEPKGNRLIALGVDNDTTGNKVAVSLFNVENPAEPSLIKRVSFDPEYGWTYSEGYNDYRAFTLMDSMGLILLPYSTWNQKEYRTENKLQLIDYTVDNLNPRGSVSQHGDILRSGTISNRLFSVSNDEVQVINAEDRDHPIITATLPLAENVRKFIPLNNGYGVMVIDKSDGTTALRSVPLSNVHQAGSKTIDLGQYCSEVIGDGNRIVAFSMNTDITTTTDPLISLFTSDETSWGTVLKIIDFTNPVKPSNRGQLDIPGNYYTEFDPHRSSQMQVWQSNRIFGLKEHVILLDCQTWIPPYYMSYAPYYRADGFHGAITVDLTDPDLPRTVSKYEYKKDISHLFTSHSMVYLTFFEELKDNRFARYYLLRVDMTDPAYPVEMKPVNIPGICIGTDDSGSVIYTYDNQYQSDGSLKTFCYTLRLSDETATLLDSAEVGGSSGTYSMDDNRIYFQPYQSYLQYLTMDSQTSVASLLDSEYAVYSVDVGKPDDIRIYKNDLNVNGCPSNVEWTGKHMLIASSASVLTLYDTSDPEKFSVADKIPVTMWLHSVDATNHSLYLSLGYNGLRVVTLYEGP